MQHYERITLSWSDVSLMSKQCITSLSMKSGQSLHKKHRYVCSCMHLNPCSKIIEVSSLFCNSLGGGLTGSQVSFVVNRLQQSLFNRGKVSANAGRVVQMQARYTSYCISVTAQLRAGTLFHMQCHACPFSCIHVTVGYSWLSRRITTTSSMLTWLIDCCTLPDTWQGTTFTHFIVTNGSWLFPPTVYVHCVCMCPLNDVNRSFHKLDRYTAC